MFGCGEGCIMRASLPTVMLQLRLTFALVAALPLFARAQSPRITPQGDPSVKADSIYRLAVDPKDYPDYPVAILLDDGVVRVESDGRTTKTFRTIVQILKPEAEIEGLNADRALSGRRLQHVEVLSGCGSSQTARAPITVTALAKQVVPAVTG